MKTRLLLMTILLIFVIVRGTFADSNPNPCDYLFKPSVSPLPSSFSVLGSSSTYNILLGYSVLIILMVLLLIAMLYMFGMAFKIDKLISFSKTEILEDLLNFLIIIFIASGMLSIDSIVVNLASFSSSVISTSLSVGSVQSLYINTCNLYFGDAENQITYIIIAASDSFLLKAIASFTVLLQPNGFGITVNPMAWYTALEKLIGIFGAFTFALIGTELTSVFLLSIIYYLFPLFLYLGILFRSFPWTRAIGGAFLGIFISFYIFFPALTYAFGEATNVILSSDISAAESSYTLNIHAVSSMFTTSNFNVFPELTFALPIMMFGLIAALSGMYTMGILISLIICFDMIEAFGDLLGAPSLSHKGVLRKVI
ncbi:MAG: hypothetical protein ACP5RT_00830 [Candidatus Micrarchaeia archaeon]